MRNRSPLRGSLLALGVVAACAVSTFTLILRSQGRARPVVAGDLAGTWRGDLEPPFWFSSLPKSSWNSVIRFRRDGWFEMTTQARRMVSHTGGHYSVTGSVLSLSYVNYVSKAQTFHYRIGRSGRVLSLQALERANSFYGSAATNAVLVKT